MHLFPEKKNKPAPYHAWGEGIRRTAFISAEGTNSKVCNESDDKFARKTQTFTNFRAKFDETALNKAPEGGSNDIQHAISTFLAR